MALRTHDTVDRPKAQVRKAAAFTLQLKAYVDSVQVVPSSATISITTPGGGPLVTPVVDAVVTVNGTGDMSYVLVAGNTGVLDQRYRAIWSYVSGGVTYQHVQIFDVVRFPLYSVVTQNDLLAHHKDLTDILFAGESSFATYIEQGFEDVYRTIEKLGKRPALILASEELRRPTEHRALHRVFSARKKQPDDRWDLLAKAHDREFDTWLSSQTFSYDEDDSGTVDSDEAKRPAGQPSWRI